jgi:hypothetical protein
MGRLAGFRYRDITRRLKALGLEFHRQAAGSREMAQPCILTQRKCRTAVLVNNSPGNGNIKCHTAMSSTPVFRWLHSPNRVHH